MSSSCSVVVDVRQSRHNHLTQRNCEFRGWSKCEDYGREREELRWKNLQPLREGVVEEAAAEEREEVQQREMTRVSGQKVRKAEEGK
jgi:hypothetical protein